MFWLLFAGTVERVILYLLGKKCKTKAEDNLVLLYATFGQLPCSVTCLCCSMLANLPAETDLIVFFQVHCLSRIREEHKTVVAALPSSKRPFGNDFYLELQLLDSLTPSLAVIKLALFATSSKLHFHRERLLSRGRDSLHSYIDGQGRVGGLTK